MYSRSYGWVMLLSIHLAGKFDCAFQSIEMQRSQSNFSSTISRLMWRAVTFAVEMALLTLTYVHTLASNTVMYRRVAILNYMRNIFTHAVFAPCVRSFLIHRLILNINIYVHLLVRATHLILRSIITQFAITHRNYPAACRLLSAMNMLRTSMKIGCAARRRTNDGNARRRDAGNCVRGWRKCLLFEDEWRKVAPETKNKQMACQSRSVFFLLPSSLSSARTRWTMRLLFRNSHVVNAGRSICSTKTESRRPKCYCRVPVWCEKWCEERRDGEAGDGGKQMQ